VYQDGEHLADLLTGQMELSQTPKENKNVLLNTGITESGIKLAK
jgi:hypothetical protein